MLHICTTISARPSSILRSYSINPTSENQGMTEAIIEKVDWVEGVLVEIMDLTSNDMEVDEDILEIYVKVG